MTYKTALKIKPYDKVHPKSKAENVTVVGTERNLMRKSVRLHCDDGNTYEHRDINPPILKIIENGQVTYSHTPTP